MKKCAILSNGLPTQPNASLQTQMFLRLVAKKKDQPRHAKNITEHPRTISFNAYLRPPTGRNLVLNWNSSFFCDRAEK